MYVIKILKSFIFRCLKTKVTTAVRLQFMQTLRATFQDHAKNPLTSSVFVINFCRIVLDYRQPTEKEKKKEKNSTTKTLMSAI